jgi:hypothetical protein
MSEQLRSISSWIVYMDVTSGLARESVELRRYSPAGATGLSWIEIFSEPSL